MTRELPSRIHATAIMINWSDPEALATFWAAFLDVEITARHGDQFAWIGRTAPGAPAVGLGAATLGRHAIGDFTWQVMRDPDGNEFCLAVH